MKKLLGYPKMLEEAKHSQRIHSWIIELILFILVYLVTNRASSVPIVIGTLFWIFSGNWSAIAGGSFNSDTASILNLMQGMPAWLSILSLFATGITTIYAIAYCREVEKRSAASMGFRKTGILKEYVLGGAIGILMITAATVTGMLTGAYSVSWSVPSVPLLVLFLLGYIIQGMSEETFCRGYLMVSMSRRTPVWICVILSSLVFACLHLFNPGISALAFLNLFLFGVITAVYIVKRGSIWGACAIHTFWNYYQGCVYGISVSGTGTEEGSVLTAVQTENMVLWTGGAFGIEGGLCVTIVLVLALLIILFLMPVSKEEQHAPLKKEAIPPEVQPSSEETAASVPDAACETSAAAETAETAEEANAANAAEISETCEASAESDRHAAPEEPAGSTSDAVKPAEPQEM